MATEQPQSKQPDRRVQRTRKSLQDALIKLILKQGYDSIGVQDIVEQANIGRSTFYTHYASKDAVLIDSFKELEVELKASVEAASTGTTTSTADVSITSTSAPLNFTKILFSHVDGHRSLYRAMAKERGGILAANHVKRIIHNLIRRDFNHRASGKVINLNSMDAAVHSVVGATFDLLNWWIDHKNDWSTDQVNDFLHTLVAPGIEAVFRD